MTPIRILSFLLLLVGINVSAQPKEISLPFSSLPMGDNRYPMDTTVELLVYSNTTEKFLMGEFIPYHAESESDLMSFIHEKLDGVIGSGDDNVEVYVGAGAGGDDRSLDNITLVNGKLPNLNIVLEYGGGGGYIPTATGFEVETIDGRIYSTLSSRNDFKDSGCSILTAQSGLERGVMGYPSPIGSREFPVKRLTIYEGAKFVSVNGDGMPLEWSEPVPSFFAPPSPPRLEVRPLMVNIRLEGRLPILAVSGDSAEYAVIEQSRDGVRWGPGVSLSSPARKSSLNEGEYLFEFEGDTSLGDTTIFYRARTTTSVSQNN